MQMVPSVSREGPEEILQFKHVALFCAAHVPLVVLLRQSELLATAHALLTVMVAVGVVLRSRKVEHAVYMAGYVVGAEVLWRMSDASVFWEFGKYATSLILLTALVRWRRLKPPALPLAYFALLLPSCALTLALLPLGEAREYVSFNLSGPFTLLLSAWLFSRISLRPVHVQRLFVAMLGPLVGIGIITAINVATGDITFWTESNFETTGGFSPNQVSAVLGLGALLCAVLSINWIQRKSVAFLLLGLAVFLVSQSALTFSRGGLVGSAGALALGALPLLRDPRVSGRLVLLGASALVVIALVLVPRLEALTGGALLLRFSETNLSNREVLLANDLETFQENPLMGVGPGMAKFQRDIAAAAHTEYTRLLAEHGVLGLFAIVLMLLVSLQHLLRAHGPTGQSLVIVLIAWSMLFMAHSAMRVAAPGFLFGLSGLRIRREEVQGGVPAPAAAPARQVQPVAWA